MKKPLGRKNYGSVPHLPGSQVGKHDKYLNEGQVKILFEKPRKGDKIFVFEKYDGSNVGVCKKDGKIYGITRSGWTADTSDFKQHQKFAEWVEDKKWLFDDILNEGERIAGEWLYQVHAIEYEILYTDPIIFFDLFTPDNKRVPIKELLKKLDANGLNMARLLHVGGAIKRENLISELNDTTHRDINAVQKPEGMVYRVENNGQFDFMAKWVRPDFEPGKYIMNGIEKFNA